MARVVVVPYNPGWPATFESLRRGLASRLGNTEARIEHVGSTSVPGLSAKPIIDIDVVVADEADVAEAIQRLGELGYEHRGDLGIEGREAFTTPEGTAAHHVYVCVEGCLPLRNHLALRDYLRRRPDEVRRYGELKEALAARFAEDIDGYMQGKTELVLEFLAAASLSPAEIETIRRQNGSEQARG